MRYSMGREGYKCRRLNFPKEYRDTKQPPHPTEVGRRALVGFLIEWLVRGNKCPTRLLDLAQFCPAFSAFLAVVIESARKHKIALGLCAE